MHSFLSSDSVVRERVSLEIAGVNESQRCLAPCLLGCFGSSLRRASLGNALDSLYPIGLAHVAAGSEGSR